MAKRKKKIVARQPPHLRARVARLRGRLRESKTQPAGLLVVNPVDIRYLTGFSGDDSWLWVPTNGRTVTILSDSRFEEQIGRDAPHARVVMRKEGLAEAFGKAIKRVKAGKIALQPDYVTITVRKKLAKELKASRLLAFDDELLRDRATKDADEVERVREALRIQQQAFRELREFLQPGQTEAESAAFLEYRMRTLGADGPSFHTIVAADANSSLPHAVPGPRKLTKGGFALIDWGARGAGLRYCGDMTRMVAFSPLKGKMREIYSVVLDAQLAALDAIREGADCRAVDKVARDLIEKAGYADQFGHGLGHGVGLDIHEQPVLSYRAPEKETLKAGQLVTVEPGIYLPGVGGVRIEDTVLVTESGCENLCDLPKSLESTKL